MYHLDFPLVFELVDGFLLTHRKLLQIQRPFLPDQASDKRLTNGAVLLTFCIERLLRGKYH